MPLISNLFRDSERLAACQRSDSAHVVPGDRGEHVRLIQIALNVIEGYAIGVAELDSRTYGPSTANAVLAYKKKRNIVNRTYQSAADNVVGRMTITALDKDMRALQTTPLPSRSRRCYKRGAPAARRLQQ